MTAPPVRTAPPRSPLPLAAIALTCCLIVYVIAVPLLLDGGAVSWQLATAIVVAVIFAIGVVTILMRLRRDADHHREELARQTARAAQLSQEADRQAEQARRQADQVLMQSERVQRKDDEIVTQAARNSELTAQLTRSREREQQLSGECARLHEENQGLRDENQSLRDQGMALQRAVRHTVTERIPKALSGEPVPAAQSDGIDPEIAKFLEDLVSGATTTGDQQDSMRAAVVALSRRVQSSAHRIQEEATLMADRHPGNTDVLEVSMRVDHAAAQQARIAQSMAVLLGEWPGQQWADPLPLVDVVRAAAGRIIAYRRVDVAGDPDVAASPSAVEPLIHLVAELLANAAQSSPPSTQVPVTVRSVQRGAVIEIHDCGVGLDDYRLEVARAVASGSKAIGLEDLGEFPQTGLAVVGQYVRRHGFRVDISESVYGGVRAIVGVPTELTETMEPMEMAALTAPAPQTPAPPGPAAPAPRVPEPGSQGAPEEDQAQVTRSRALPRRVSPRHSAARETASPVPAAPAPEPVRPVEPPSPEEAGAWMGAFLTAQQPGETTRQPGETTQQPGGEPPAAPDDDTATWDDNSTWQQEQE